MNRRRRMSEDETNGSEIMAWMNGQTSKGNGNDG